MFYVKPNPWRQKDVWGTLIEIESNSAERARQGGWQIVRKILMCGFAHMSVHAFVRRLRRVLTQTSVHVLVHACVHGGGGRNALENMCLRMCVRACAHARRTDDIACLQRWVCTSSRACVCVCLHEWRGWEIILKIWVCMYSFMCACMREDVEIASLCVRA